MTLGTEPPFSSRKEKRRLSDVSVYRRKRAHTCKRTQVCRVGNKASVTLSQTQTKLASFFLAILASYRVLQLWRAIVGFGSTNETNLLHQTTLR